MGCFGWYCAVDCAVKLWSVGHAESIPTEQSVFSERKAKDHSPEKGSNWVYIAACYPVTYITDTVLARQ